MDKICIEHGSARDVFHGRNHVFKIPKGEKGISENGFEIELGQKSKLALSTFNLRSSGIISLDSQYLFNVREDVELGSLGINRNLFSEILAYSQNIKQIVNGIGGIEIGDINVQRKLNKNNVMILKKLFRLIHINGKIGNLKIIVDDILSMNFKGNDKIRHTLTNIGNFGITGDNEILLVDGGISLEFNEEELLEKLDLIYDFFNDKSLFAEEVLSDCDFGISELIKLYSTAA